MRFAALAILFYATSAYAAPPAIEAHVRAGALSGTMLRPKASGAAILIIPGSGPTDRDGNNQLGIKGSPYRVLAEALAGRGVTTVRADKRGMFGGSSTRTSINAVTIDDYARDVHAWVKVIRHETGAPCVWVAGHSEENLVALATSQKPEGLCGLILLAAPGRRLGEIMLEQLRSALGEGPALQQAASVIQAIEAGRHPNMRSMHPGTSGAVCPRGPGSFDQHVLL